MDGVAGTGVESGGVIEMESKGFQMRRWMRGLGTPAVGTAALAMVLAGGICGIACGDDAGPTTAPAAASTGMTGGSTPADAPAIPPASPENADQLLSRMLQPASGNGNPSPLQPIAHPPAADATSGSGAVAPGAPTVTVMREGSFIVDRTGRLTRSADGQQMEFTFDADGVALKDPPLVILPNLKLMTMENAVSSSNKDLRFRVTGMVTEYRGRNYLLLDKAVVIPDVVQQF